VISKCYPVRERCVMLDVYSVVVIVGVMAGMVGLVWALERV
jgi:hypothetical protein